MYNPYPEGSPKPDYWGEVQNIYTHYSQGFYIKQLGPYLFFFSIGAPKENFFEKSNFF
jgi:hypothetical protein